MSTETENILNELRAEREKQINRGFDSEHDDIHLPTELPDAAAFVAAVAADKSRGKLISPVAPRLWPWTQEDWERITRHDARRLRVIAAAMLVAELERWERNPIKPSRKAGFDPRD